MFTIAAGIILAFIIITFFGVILDIIVSLGFLIIIGAIIIGGIALILSYPDLFLPIIAIGGLLLVISFLAKSLSNFHNRIENAYLLIYFRYRFLRFTSQSKINYYKNLEIAKRQREQKLAKKVQLEKKIEEQKKYDRQVKRFAKLIYDLKKIEKKINKEKKFLFRYEDLNAMIYVNKDFDDRSLKFDYGYEKKTFLNEPRFTLEGNGDGYSIKENGTRKEIINKTIEEIGKILAKSEN